MIAEELFTLSRLIRTWNYDQSGRVDSWGQDLRNEWNGFADLSKEVKDLSRLMSQLASVIYGPHELGIAIHLRLWIRINEIYQ